MVKLFFLFKKQQQFIPVFLSFLLQSGFVIKNILEPRREGIIHNVSFIQLENSDLNNFNVLQLKFIYF